MSTTVEELEKRLKDAEARRDVQAMQQIRRQLVLLKFPQAVQDVTQVSQAQSLDCSNVDMLDPTTPAWTEEHRPDITIAFQDPSNPRARPNRQCYNRQSLRDYIKQSVDFRMWVPNAQRQMTQVPIDPESGHGGIPSLVEAYIRLPDSTLIIVDPAFVRKMTPGQYEGIPLYSVRYGNARGEFGAGQAHGQMEVPLYLVVSTDAEQQLQQLEYCLERHIRLRDPYGHGHYARMRPSVRSRDSVLAAIRQVHSRFPVPVLDLFHDFDADLMKKTNSFSFNLHRYVSLLDQYILFLLQNPEALEKVWTQDQKRQFVTDYQKHNHIDAGPSAYPKPLFGTDVARRLLEGKMLLFRWDSIAWRPIILLLQGSPNLTAVKAMMPEMTEEEQQMLLQGKTSNRYRLVTAASSEQELELLEFSLFPGLMYPYFVYEYAKYDLALEHFVLQLQKEGVYFEQRAITSSLKKGGAADEARLRADKDVKDFLIAVDKSGELVLLTKKQPGDNSLNVARDFFWLSDKFRSLVKQKYLTFRQDLSQQEFLSTLRQQLLFVDYIIVRSAKRSQQGSEWSFRRLVQTGTSLELEEDEMLLSSDPEIGWQLLQTDQQWYTTFLETSLLLYARQNTKLNFSRYLLSDTVNQQQKDSMELLQMSAQQYRLTLHDIRLIQSLLPQLKNPSMADFIKNSGAVQYHNSEFDDLREIQNELGVATRFYSIT